MSGFERLSANDFQPDRDIPDLSGKVVLVTGGNIGLGRETVFQLAKHNPSKIYLAARNREKAEKTIQELEAELKNHFEHQQQNDAPSNSSAITFLELDLTSFDSIKSATRTFLSKSDRLDVLVNNAGIMACPAGQTKEGYEIQFGTNHVGHALLTKLLMPTLLQTAKSPSPVPSSSPSTEQNASDVRVISLSSAAETFAPKSPGLYNFATVKTPDAGGLGTWQRYGMSKLANVHYSRMLHEHYNGTSPPGDAGDKGGKVTFCAVHPGSVGTNLGSGPIASYPLFKYPIKAMLWLITVSVQKGALNQLWASTAAPRPGGPDEGQKAYPKSGVFYWPVGVEGKDSKQAKDDELAKKLWDWTEKELQGHEL